MKTTTKVFTMIMAVIMLLAVIPFNAFAATYTVYLHCGPEGWGSTAYTLYKDSSTALPLYHEKQTVYENYAMLPGYQTFSDQRTFIEWNTAYNATTGRGTGTAYYDYYTANASTTLYAIWGYNIQFNADGGTYPTPTSGKDIYLTYVASYNLQNQSDPKTDYSYCMPDVFNNIPTKAGCKRVSSNGRPSYALLNSDMTFFCWETPDQNLTIPPIGGYMEWEEFHCTNSAKGRAPEFFAIWEPSVSYNANGGSGSMSTDYLSWTGDALWSYKSYTAKSNKFTKSGATFTGWNTKADGTGISVPVGTQLGGQKSNSDPITLYAQWSDGSSGGDDVTPPETTKAYTLTFDPNGGTMTSASSFGINYGENFGVALGGTMPTATRSGYTFTGWYNEKYGYTLNLSDNMAVQENVTFKAQWTQIPAEEDYATGYYEVTATSLNMRSGPGADYSQVSYLSNGAQVYISQTSGRWGYCTYNGKTGWISLAYCKYLGDSIDTVNKYTLTFDTNGGTMPQGYSTTYTFEPDQKFVDVIGGYPVPTRSGHVFEGWRRTDYTTDFWVSSWGTQPYTFGHDITVKAEWTATHTHSYTATVTTAATCTTSGVKTYRCSCGDSYTETISALGHSYSSKVTAPTCTEKGYTAYSCSICGHSYTDNEIDATGHSFGAWYTVVEPTVTSEGTERRDCANCGAYETNILDMLEPEPTEDPYITADGVTMTVHNLSGVKDYFIANGDYDTYRDVKNNLIVQITQNRIKGANEYTYIVPNFGRHTVYIRYEDSTKAATILKVDLVGNVPELSANGLQLTVNNLGGVKLIRTAYGDHASPSAIKKATGARAFTYVLNGKEEYTIQYRENGIVTVAVIYNNGYVHIFKHEIQKKVPTFVQNNNTVTFGNLNGLKVVRYAPGVYSTSSQIKAAAGSKTVTPASVVDGQIIISKLAVGIYTFCVQYDDESYNYYTVTVD
ncbi:MAG: InlB B-repeat-containing protein [Clostridia bacterium]|nr:InlB B-repeat-containing protein [Clostridia bacterium]